MTGEPRPAPLTPEDCDLRDFPFMPLDYQRLFRSDWWIAACFEAPAAAAAAVNLWGAAWQQVPAGSLPLNDTLLMRYAMLEPALWKKVRARVLQPWVECDDGRLYHPVVAEKALGALSRKRPPADEPTDKTERQKRWRQRLKDMAQQLRDLGIDVPAGATMQRMQALLRAAGVDEAVDGEASTLRLHDTSTGESETGKRVDRERDTDSGDVKAVGAATIDVAATGQLFAKVCELSRFNPTDAQEPAERAIVAQWLEGRGCGGEALIVQAINMHLQRNRRATKSLGDFEGSVRELQRLSDEAFRPGASAASNAIDPRVQIGGRKQGSLQ